jgi:hypothetical protein
MIGRAERQRSMSPQWVELYASQDIRLTEEVYAAESLIYTYKSLPGQSTESSREGGKCNLPRRITALQRWK